MIEFGFGHTVNVIIHVAMWVLGILGIEGIIGFSAYKIGKKVAFSQMKNTHKSKTPDFEKANNPTN
jgi:hypothetical protein